MIVFIDENIVKWWTSIKLVRLAFLNLQTQQCKTRLYVYNLDLDHLAFLDGS